MRLKAIEISGFKSFAEKTVISFPSVITSIVGPNGCGKSNIVDALRWAMGEQSARHLRGQSMEDVIFNGSERLSPIGMAEVTMLLDNVDQSAPTDYSAFSEIAVTRRIFRSGESEYAINKAPCRLRDVVELFLGTGAGNKAYSIIGQGRVEEMVNAKPEERRRLIEEAAGTTRFKNRKLAAERKMDRTRQNLLRVNDIVREVERQVRTIELQAKKAERYKGLQGELRQRELDWGALRKDQLDKDIAGRANELAALEDRITELTTHLAAREVENERNRVAVLELDKILAAIQEEVYQQRLDMQREEQKIGFLHQDEKELRNSIERGNADTLGIQARLDILSGEISELDKASENFKQLSLFEEQYVERKEEDLAGLRAQIEMLREKAEHEKEQLIERANELSNLNNAKTFHQRRLEQTEADRSGKEAERAEVVRGLESLRERCLTDAASLEQCRERAVEVEARTREVLALITHLGQRRTEREAILERLKEELHEVRSSLASLETLQKNFEGYQQGVRAVMLKHQTSGANGSSDGVYGVVADVIEAPAEMEKALTAVLGERLQYIIVQSHKEGMEAIEYLKHESAGRGGFIPRRLERENPNSGVTLSSPDIIAPLLQSVTVKDGFGEVANYLLRDVAVVKDLPSGLGLWRRNGFAHHLVTLDGEVIDPMGVVTGGSTDSLEGNPISRRRHVKELRERLGVVEGNVNQEDQTLAAIKAELERSQAEREAVAQKAHEVEVQRVQAEHQSVQREQDCQRAEQHLETLDRELDNLSVEISALEDSIRECDSGVDDGLNDKMHREAALRDFQASLMQVEETFRRAESQLTESRIRAASVREKKENSQSNLEDRMNLQSELLEQLTARRTQLAEMVRKLAEIGRARGQAESLAETVKAQLVTMEEDLEAKRRSYRELSRQVGEIEEAIREIRPDIDSAQADRSRLQLMQSEKGMELRHLFEDLRDKYAVEVSDLESVEIEGVRSGDELREEIADLKGRLQRMGAVNLTAIGEFEELSERGQFLKAQKEDLERSMADLQETITKLNRICRLRFKESFEEVNLKFQETFPRLFNGGKARLVLTDESNYLETGVDIVAQPPGKKLQSISLLSGGEKALTAVSLLFAIFLTKPSPFCVLDEVDAPLDDVNIDRFIAMVQEMTDSSQFMLITHNKKTMQAAEVLYGITMEDPGVSKVVSVRMV